MRPNPADRRRWVVGLAARVGVLMLASGAQARETERSVRAVATGLGLPETEVVVSYSTVMVSNIDSDPAPVGEGTSGTRPEGTVAADVTTAIQAVRVWQPDYHRLAAAAALVRNVHEGRTDLAAAQAGLDRAVAIASPYPRWLRFAAPALLSYGVTIMFGGRLLDALTTLGIGLAIQPALERIERSELSAFFQTLTGVAATTLFVVLLVKIGIPIHGGLVLTGSLLRFLPGAALVAGMHDFLDGALTSGVTRLAEVFLYGAAVAGAASVVLSFGAGIGVRLRITTAGQEVWPAGVIVATGTFAVTCYALRLAVPWRVVVTVAILGAVVVVLGRGMTPLTAGMGQQLRTLVAALTVGVLGQTLAHRARQPAALWLVPTILPLLPAPSTLLPLLAETEAARQALQGQALATAFSIGVGVGCGSILLETSARSWPRLIHPRHPQGRTRTAP
ncbi:membrane hypothetical protein [Nostocoides japonicum T1-X7]|uniref:Threonine/serine exporter-like N-terminal domain-containing protein n=1 Tax=Nostocoides japonicum T1-X7 TaxID=1194083 RepID=A0A077LY16_9MICO|nr:threonine/serine exporter family protein [Tetrasphaera japonica]CCH78561.1 membrane hypothetical protein [Tetrasphaera japonica T1-X7]